MRCILNSKIIAASLAVALLSVAFGAATNDSSAAQSQDSGKVGANDHIVSIKGMSFQPTMLTVPVGTTIIWKNLDEEPHTVANGMGIFRSNALDQSDTFSFKFTQAGSYPYLCAIHPQMTGTIVVK